MKFQLVPFEKNGLTSVLNLTGEIQFSEVLSISYHLKGNLSDIVIPQLSARPSVQDKLWETTCFEFFLKLRGAQKYFEWNLSPSGEWNQFEFDSYRERSKQAHLIQLPKISTSQGQGQFQLDCTVNLSSLKRISSSWQIGVTAVLEHSDGERSYWALRHLGDKPDFHLSDSFILLGEM